MLFTKAYERTGQPNKKKGDLYPIRKHEINTNNTTNLGLTILNFRYQAPKHVNKKLEPANSTFVLISKVRKISQYLWREIRTTRQRSFENVKLHVLSSKMRLPSLTYGRCNHKWTTMKIPNFKELFQILHLIGTEELGAEGANSNALWLTNLTFLVLWTHLHRIQFVSKAIQNWDSISALVIRVETLRFS
ncbi:hypothetical protein HS088_TW13G00041 [Tripterygium wilfordii]|uniref:Uncharacterized protein n=1 Tax=Tripterygium wilfordii TaxID=458696 RepID=A0A7J7CSV0_TRIWF|nr:hypothetical protein HS088_TW13G00041 [Tripterygium wilfordii]